MARLLILIALCTILWSLESHREQRFRRALPNIGLAALVIVMNLALSFAAAWTASIDAGLLARMELPLWIELVIAIAALDFFAYVAHVTMHKSALGWRFHRVHHTEEEVDVTTAFRQHPGESVWRILWQLPAILLFAIPLWMVVVYLTISSINAQLEHASLALPDRIDRLVRLLFVTPNMHKVHHSAWQKQTDSNYANIFTLWDRLFGTYTSRADLATLRYGLEEESPRTLRGLLALPFARS